MPIGIHTYLCVYEYMYIYIYIKIYKYECRCEYLKKLYIHIDMFINICAYVLAYLCI